MRKGLTVVCAAIAALGFLQVEHRAQAKVGGGDTVGTLPLIGGAVKREPALLFDVTGSSFAGPVHTSLVVYDDGLVSYANYATFLPAGESTLVLVDEQDVKLLTRLLDLAGADVLGDSVGVVPDLPLTTVTFLRPGTDAKAHTFSYVLGTSGHQAVGTIVYGFIQEHVFGQASSTSFAGGGAAIAAGGFFKQEPIVIHDVTGSTFAGPFHQSLTVFNNGHVSYSTHSTFNEGQAFEKQVPLEAVQQLNRDLAQLGALVLQDSADQGADIPLTTVTYMRPNTDTTAHTFSYLLGGPAHQAVSSRLSAFLTEFVLTPDQL